MHLNEWIQDRGASPKKPHSPSADGVTSASDNLATAQIIKQAIADMAANRDMRRLYSAKAYRLAAACLVMWTTLLVVQGTIKALFDIEMWSDQVLIAVTTGVTVSVLAAFLGVIRGLFPGKGKDAEAAKAAA